MPQFVFLWTDVFVQLLVLAILAYGWHVARSPALRAVWARVGASPSAMSAGVVLSVFLVIGVLDSVHYRPLLPAMESTGAAQAGDEPPARTYSPVLRSALDDLLGLTKLTSREKTYSEPLALYQFVKESFLVDGEPVRDFPRLAHAGTQLQDEGWHRRHIVSKIAWGALYGLAAALAAAFALTLCHRIGRATLGAALAAWWCGESGVPWRAMWLTFGALALLAGMGLSLATDYHVLGTDRTGVDVLWQCLKSIRTALVIGTLTTCAMIPPALLFGISAGYFKGWVDDVIQYVYTTLTSIPGVLLIAACVLMMQVYIDTHPELFDTMASRADLRLFMLCLILGLTGWAGLCRLLRAETLKLRELEYVQAARAFGVGHWRIMARHVLPNVMHIVLITLVLEFSSLVLYEAVLSYLGIGVDPSTPSFGTMIDAARLEMSRDPMIWWNLLAAFVFLLVLVLSANIFADGVRDAFDPRSRRFKPTRAVQLALAGLRGSRSSPASGSSNKEAAR